MRTFLCQVLPFVLSVRPLAVFLTIKIDNMVSHRKKWIFLFREGEKLASLRRTRVLRAYAGVRPLVASDDDPSGRNVSRGIVFLTTQA